MSLLFSFLVGKGPAWGWYPGTSLLGFFPLATRADGPALCSVPPSPAPIPPPGVEAATSHFGGMHLKGGHLGRRAWEPGWKIFSVPADFECTPRSESSTPAKINLTPPTKPLCPLG